MRLLGTPAQLPPAVNIELPERPALGPNHAILRPSGPIDPTRYTLRFTVSPIESGAKQKGLDQGRTTTELDVETRLSTDEPTQIAYTLDQFSAAHLVATLSDNQGNGVVSRSLMSVTVQPKQVQPIEVTLRQPFVSTEDSLPAEVRLNLSDEKLAGATVRAVLLAEEDRVI